MEPGKEQEDQRQRLRPLCLEERESIRRLTLATFGDNDDPADDLDGTQLLHREERTRWIRI